MLKRPSNKPRADIERIARQMIETGGGPDLARVWFKYDCGTCGSRETAPEPNVLPATAVCEVCGATTAIVGGGAALQMRRDRFVPWDKNLKPGHRTLVIRKPYESDRGDA